MNKIYLSKMAISKDIVVKENKIIDELIAKLKKRYEVIYIPDDKFMDYNYSGIENIISSSDCFLAVIDKYWSASTWRLSELTYAVGDTTLGTRKNKNKKVIPTFVLYSSNNYTIAWIEKHEMITVLTNNVNDSLSILNQVLSKHLIDKAKVENPLMYLNDKINYYEKTIINFDAVHLQEAFEKTKELLILFNENNKMKLKEYYNKNKSIGEELGTAYQQILFFVRDYLEWSGH